MVTAKYVRNGEQVIKTKVLSMLLQLWGLLVLLWYWGHGHHIICKEIPAVAPEPPCNAVHVRSRFFLDEGLWSRNACSCGFGVRIWSRCFLSLLTVCSRVCVGGGGTAFPVGGCIQALLVPQSQWTCITLWPPKVNLVSLYRQTVLTPEVWRTSICYNRQMEKTILFLLAALQGRSKPARILSLIFPVLSLSCSRYLYYKKSVRFASSIQKVNRNYMNLFKRYKTI